MEPSCETGLGGSGRDHLFVYGSLRTDLAGAAARRLASGAERLGWGRMRGRLYVVDWYPGAVDSEADADLVLGEVYWLREERLLVALDEYEECEAGLFRRVRRPVQLSGGGELEAWAYLYGRTTAGLVRIDSGDYADWFGRGGADESGCG